MLFIVDVAGEFGGIGISQLHLSRSASPVNIGYFCWVLLSPVNVGYSRWPFSRV
jgi:hypothetical protein